MTVEEHQITGGLGGAVSEYLSENYPVPVKRVRIKDRYVESGAPNELLKKFGLSHNNIRQLSLDNTYDLWYPQKDGDREQQSPIVEDSSGHRSGHYRRCSDV